MFNSTSINDTDTNNWLGKFLALLVLGDPPKIMTDELMGRYQDHVNTRT